VSGKGTERLNKMKNLSVLCVILVFSSFVAIGQNTESCTDYWNNQYLQGKLSCNKQGYITGTLQGVDCSSTTMDGLPTCCNAKCPAHQRGWEIAKDSDVDRRITKAVGKPHHQRCTNHGIEGGVTDDGFVNCCDSFVNEKTGTECKVNPDMQRGFICKQKP
jgi:hypothetical protein